MVKRTISIATILLVIFVVGIVYTKASPRVNGMDAVDRGVYVVDNGVRDLAATGLSVELVGDEVSGQRFNVRVRTVDLFDVGAEKHVGRAVSNGFGDDVLADFHQDAATDHRRALLGAHDQSYNFYLNNRRNRDGATRHLNFSNLAVRNMRFPVVRQLGNVLSGLCQNDLQNVRVFETAGVSYDSPVVDVSAAPVFDSFGVSGLKALTHRGVVKAHLPMQGDEVTVTDDLVRLGLAVG